MLGYPMFKVPCFEVQKESAWAANVCRFWSAPMPSYESDTSSLTDT